MCAKEKNFFCAIAITTVNELANNDYIYNFAMHFNFQINTHQTIVITNGTESFAVFTYLCGAMAWHGNATIGFNAGGTFFKNHPLSGTADVSSIACEDSSHMVWTNLVYKLTPRGKFTQYIKT